MMLPRAVPSNRGEAAPVRWASRVLLLALLGGAASAPGCVSLLELEGYADASSELCSKLLDCFGEAFLPGCESRLQDRIADATEEQRQAWLGFFADNSCLESCVNARRCLDESPLCATAHDLCSQPQHCCGFSTGLGDCSGSESSSGRCCAPDGLSCAGDGDCCDGDCLDGLCGGVECRAAGEDCSDGTPCCSGLCAPATRRCSESTCLDDGAECVEHWECCSESCGMGLGDPVATCQPASCLPDGVECAPPLDCCGGHCQIDDFGDGWCSSSECLPAPASCVTDDQCCSNLCRPGFGQCVELPCTAFIGDACPEPSDCCAGVCNGSVCECAADGYPCNHAGECCSLVCSPEGTCGDSFDCTPPGGACSAGSVSYGDSECCSQLCLGGTCCSVAGCLHGVCQVGMPLRPDCDQCAGCNVNGITTCPELLCLDNDLPQCCCNFWGPECVAAAKLHCGAPCPN